jgi:hypothetical protein
MRKVWYLLPLSALWVASCASPPPPPVRPDPVPEPVVVPAQTFEVTPEKKRATLAEIRVLVDKLNAIIARKSFNDWKPHLDQDYIRTFSDPSRLKEYSDNSPFLKQFNVKLKTLEDFFKFVVVPSRADTVVDDISFVDETRVNVFTVVDNEKVLLYLLKLYDKEWKISSW